MNVRFGEPPLEWLDSKFIVLSSFCNSMGQPPVDDGTQPSIIHSGLYATGISMAVAGIGIGAVGRVVAHPDHGEGASWDPTVAILTLLGLGLLAAGAWWWRTRVAIDSQDD